MPSLLNGEEKRNTNFSCQTPLAFLWDSIKKYLLFEFYSHLMIIDFSETKMDYNILYIEICLVPNNCRLIKEKR